MIRAALLALVLAALTGSAAQALSCARPDVARSYQIANDAADTFRLYLGTVDYADPAPHKQAGPTTLKARMQARGITRTGFSAWVERDVTINVTCTGHWCGGVPEQERLLIFLRQDGADGVIDAPPCGGFVFPNPGQADMRILRTCLSGGPCTPRYR